MLSIFVRYY